MLDFILLAMLDFILILVLALQPNWWCQIIITVVGSDGWDTAPPV
jgi:hypothetical protein